MTSASDRDSDQRLRPRDRSGVGKSLELVRSRLASIGPPGATYQWDLSALDRVVSFHPADMVLAVETGLTLQAVKNLVENENLWLPLDATADGDPTLTEYLARDISIGWLSHRYGTARDWIMGITAANDQGREVRSGAQVVKNVAGYRLAPLYIGAWHALGPLLEVTFRLLPMPSPVTVARWMSDHPAPLLAIWRQSLQDSHPAQRGEPWEALSLERLQDSWQLRGFTRSPARTVSGWAEAIEDAPLGEIAEEASPPRERAAMPWQPVFRIQVLPSRIPELVHDLHHLGEKVICYPSSGVVLLGMASNTADREQLVALLSNTAENGGLVLPLSPKLPIQVPPPEGPAAEQAIMARIKAILDPDGVFGPLPEGLW